MNPTNRISRWVLLPVGGVLAAGALLISGGFTSAQTPESDATATPVPTEATPDATTTSDMPSYDEILAEELGITAEELREARSNAQEQYIDELVEAGVITEEQAQDLKDWNPAETLQEIFSGTKIVEIREFILTQLAEVYDMDREALEQDLADGMTLMEIAEEQGADASDIRGALQAQIDEMLNMAVEADVLTQEQADDLSEAIDRLVSLIAGADDDATTDSDMESTPGMTPDATSEPEETPTVGAP